MKKGKKILTVVAAMTLSAGLAVGGTLAYLSTITNTATNKFTSSKNITGELTETDWKYGEDGWTDYKPGDSTAKNPQIEVAGDVYAVAGMRVICKDTDNNAISFNDFQSKYATVSTTLSDNDKNGITDDWTKMNTADGSDFFYYNTTVNDGSTNPLFTSVKINAGIKSVYYATEKTPTIKKYSVDAEGNKTLVSTTTGETVTVNEGEMVYAVDKDGNEVLANAVLPHFDIVITGYAAQAENQNAVSAPSATDLSALAALAGVTLQ